MTHVEIPGKHLHLPPKCLVSGFYLNELLMRLLHRMEPQVEVFSCYDDVLRKLALIDESCDDALFYLQSYLRYFEMSLLHALGYGVTLDIEADSGRQVQADENYEFQIDHGPVKLIDGSHESGFGVKVGGNALLALAQQSMMQKPIDPKIFRDCKRLMRAILDRYLGEKPLISRQLFSHNKK
jgi:DNA repair protein RecO (recombination protein O)